MQPFSFLYRVDNPEQRDRDRQIGELNGFVRRLEEDDFVVGGQEPRAFYDGHSDVTHAYVIWDKRIWDRRYKTARECTCGYLYRDGMLGVFNEPGNRLLEFMERYEIETAEEPLPTPDAQISPRKG